MVNSIKDLFEINRNAASEVTIVISILDFRHVRKSIISGQFVTKTILFKEESFLKEVGYISLLCTSFSTSLLMFEMRNIGW